MPQARLCGCWGGRVLPLLLAYVCYLLLGAAVFQLLEKQAEAQSRDQVQFEKLRFLENYTCLDQRALEQFVQVRGEARGGRWAECGFSRQVRSYHPGADAARGATGSRLSPSAACCATGSKSLQLPAPECPV